MKNILEISLTESPESYTGLVSGIVGDTVILTDHDGSMGAFEGVSDWIAKLFGTAAKCYYFYNAVQAHCFCNKSHTKAITTDELVAQIGGKTNVIIISDAGAARGSNSTLRFKATVRFMIKLKQATKRIVWLNPMPKRRWADTTAERIARFVRMGEIGTVVYLRTFLKQLTNE